MRRKLWLLGVAHDTLFALALVTGGPIAVLVGLVQGSAETAGLGGLAFVGGVALGISLIRSEPPAKKQP